MSTTVSCDKTCKSLWQTTVEVMKLSAPNVAGCLILFLGQIATVQSFSQRDARAEVSAIGLGGFMFSMFGLAIGLGLSGALDTIVSQAIGSGKTDVASVNLAQARLVTLLAVAPCALILSYTKPILVGIKMDLDFAADAAQYTHWQMIGLMPLFWYCALSCFLRASNRTTAPLVANLVGTVIHVVLAVVLLYVFEFGVITASLIAAGANIARWITLELYIYLLPTEESSICSIGAFFRTLGDKSRAKQVFSGITVFTLLALPSTAMMWSEWFAAEAQTLIAGLTHKAYVAANIELATVSVFAFMVPVGICQTASFLVGSSLGRGDAKSAKQYSVVSLMITSIAMVVIAIAFYFTRNYLVNKKAIMADLRADSVIALDQMMKAFPILCAFTWIDGMQNVLEAILRGMRMQRSAVWIKMFSMLGVRLILGYVLCVHANMGVEGLWIGATVGMFISSSVYTVMLMRADFEAKADEAKFASEAVDTGCVTPDQVKAL